ncbi:MAG: radical SAM family heme chaperone HemW [Candidatus Omnitrophica bacterium]|nr:radical SAM family heme chaperone HemW [Candidatus Omnitrophota bacterium]
MKSLYIHIPFCKQKCFYCSFSVVVGREKDTDEYLENLFKESMAYKGSDIDTLYVGGGTPGILAVEQIQKLFFGVRRNFIISPNAEVAIELNPENITDDKINAMLNAGVNRVSVGVQTFDEKYLKYLGRAHNAQDSKNAITLLRKAGFKNVSVDLMFGFKDQTPRELEHDLNAVIGLGCDHISIYALSVDTNSLFKVRQEPTVGKEKFAKYYFFVNETLKKNGYAQYEVSNYYRLGFASRHNFNYWQGGDYIGLGVAAHSHISGHRYWNYSKFSDYMNAIQNTGRAIEGEEFLDNRTRFKETLLLGLRMNAGVNVKAIEKRFNEYLSDEENTLIAQFVRDGFLERFGDVLAATDKGRIVLDEICARLY